MVSPPSLRTSTGLRSGCLLIARWYVHLYLGSTEGLLNCSVRHPGELFELINSFIYILQEICTKDLKHKAVWRFSQGVLIGHVCPIHEQCLALPQCTSLIISTW